jgi:hypothetical protein
MVQKTIKRTKRTPCIMPNNLTGSGMLAKYFKGIAMNRSIKKEIPSAKAMYRNVFRVFIILDF